MAEEIDENEKNKVLGWVNNTFSVTLLYIFKSLNNYFSLGIRMSTRRLIAVFIALFSIKSIQVQ